MSEFLTPDEAIARVPGWSPGSVHVDAVLAGMTNRSYLLKKGRERFVLRLDAAHTDTASLDRATEHRVHQRAAAAGFAPDILYADPDAGLLVTRYVDGRPLTADDLQDSSGIQRLALLLRRVHALEPAGRRFDAAGAARHYAAALPGEAGLRAAADRCVAIIDSTPAGDTLCCCHNDVIADNLLLGERLVLIDWEYAADNDPYFDLACPLAYHELAADIADNLLSAYGVASMPEARERLAVQQRHYDALHWLWLARRQSISPEAGIARRLDELLGRIR